VRLLPYLDAFANELEKIAEFAPGIPFKGTTHELPHVKEPSRWEYGVHRHLAERRGEHLDLRLGDPDTGRAHSWALTAKWPKPGETTWAIQQPTHTIRYMDFSGHIREGYGKGKVELQDRDKVEVVSAKPDHVSFNVYRSSGAPEEYTLHRIHEKKWRLLNRTPIREKLDIPDSKPKYRETNIEKADRHISNDDWIASAKVDDAHNLFLLSEPGDQIRVVSHRTPKRGETGLIDHTHKVPTLFGTKTPKGLGNTILRGGLYAMNPQTGRATEAKDLSGLLSTSVWKSRQKQEHFGELRPLIYDVVKFRGKNMENSPYAEKLEVLQQIASELPFELPRMARGTGPKLKLIADIKGGRIPETKEGVVFWNLKERTPAVKAKFVTDHDVYVRDFFSGEGKYAGNAVGGFTFSHEPDGPIVGKVGTGLSDAARRDMALHPDRYHGLVARVAAQEKFQSGALRAPSFKGWHLDKNDPSDLSTVKV
jgi:hypothetical protein